MHNARAKAQKQTPELLAPKRYLLPCIVILVVLSVCGLQTFLSPALGDEAKQSVMQRYYRLNLKGLPAPPLNLNQPAPPPAVLGGRNLKTIDADELLALAKSFSEEDEYVKASTAQYRAVAAGRFGKYDLSCYLSLANRKDDAFYWLEVAAMEEGCHAAFAEDDYELVNLKKDPRWQKVFKFLKECDQYWMRTGKAPKTTRNAWFTVPDAVARTQAIGALTGESTTKALAFSENPLFRPMPEPLPYDWLSIHKEPGQTFEQFKQSHPEKLGQKGVLYLQPFGVFPKDGSPSVSQLRAFMQAFFQVRTEVLPTIDLSKHRITSRINPNTDRPQFLTSDIHDLLAANRPANACAVLGITMADLSTRAKGRWWNFLFGQADTKRRVAVYSFARFDPKFFKKQRTSNFASMMLRRSCATMAHETGHMFGVAHCTFFHCVMNGTNNLPESDNAPLHVCPVDLRKLQYCLGFDTRKRYESLRNFYRSVHFDDESRWTDNMLARLAKPR